MAESGGFSVEVHIPDIETLTDEEMSTVAEMRDGRWSEMTKAILQRLGASKLDLNTGWASVWQSWSCPCCKRTKPEIARLSAGDVALCHLEYHHDHLRDLAKKIYREINPLSDDKGSNIQISRIKDLVVPLTERFETTLICKDCNLAEGDAKRRLSTSIHESFSFRPSEIETFITASQNKPHDVDIAKAEAAWRAAEEDFLDRIDFARRMAQRVNKGRHRRDVAFGQRGLGQVQPRDFVYKLFSAGAPSGYHYGIGASIDVRSVSRDGAGSSPKPRKSAGVRGRAPSDAEFAVIVASQADSKHWTLAGDDWVCACCGRNKREICRKSNSGKWTAQIHSVNRYHEETDGVSLYYRRLSVDGTLVVGSDESLLICQDCRNIFSESKRRDPSANVDILTTEEIRQLIPEILPNTQVVADFDAVIKLAAERSAYADAVEDYHSHRREALAALGRVKQMIRFWRLTWEDARNELADEYARTMGLEVWEAEEYADWILREGRRLSPAE